MTKGLLWSGEDRIVAANPVSDAKKLTEIAPNQRIATAVELLAAGTFSGCSFVILAGLELQL